MACVREATAADAAAWIALRAALWPDAPAGEHRGEVEAYLAGRFPRSPWCAVVAEADGAVVGFAEVSERAHAEGCASPRVAYLEGWFVEPAHRGRGVGGALVAACEAWARARGLTEMGSDAEVENEGSAAAHRALGFADVGLVRLFVKRLDAAEVTRPDAADAKRPDNAKEYDDR